MSAWQSDPRDDRACARRARARRGRRLGVWRRVRRKRVGARPRRRAPPIPGPLGGGVPRALPGGGCPRAILRHASRTGGDTIVELMDEHSTRRDFLKAGLAGSLGAALTPAFTHSAAAADRDKGAPSIAPFVAPPLERVRIGFVGV